MKIKNKGVEITKECNGQISIEDLLKGMPHDDAYIQIKVDKPWIISS